MIYAQNGVTVGDIGPIVVVRVAEELAPDMARWLAEQLVKAAERAEAAQAFPHKEEFTEMTTRVVAEYLSRFADMGVDTIRVSAEVPAIAGSDQYPLGQLGTIALKAGKYGDFIMVSDCWPEAAFRETMDFVVRHRASFFRLKTVAP